MSSAAQILANRQNSAHSTGPVTAAGKETASRNALRHGLTSKQIVIPGEDPAAYDAHRESLLREFRPANDIERALAEELAACAWRLARARRVETAVLSKIIGNAPDPDAALAESFLERPKELDRLIRYITSIERAHWQAFRKLEQVQKARVAQEQQQAIEQAWLARVSAQRQAPAAARSEIGFVSQSADRSAAEAANLRGDHTRTSREQQTAATAGR